MTDVGLLAVIGLLVLGLIGLGWWLLIETEGVYLGRRVVIWLYDRYADRYDRVKNFRREYDHMFLAQPIMSALASLRAPLVLDVATGTGRLPLALARHPLFQGRVIALDLSRKMLTQAAAKLHDERTHAEQTILLWAPAEDLPFPDDTFDVVTCLESLEFMESPEAVLRELVRVLRPNGQLLITQRLTGRWMPGKTWSERKLRAILESMGVERVTFDYWQVDYQRVWGTKSGESLPTLARPLAEVLRCPVCHSAMLIEHGDCWVCPTDGFRAPVMADGVIELTGPQLASHHNSH
ncbi:MAG: methyltransferase domain-containing protein [Chloroflexi bacterium]|nr:methyltransferase domain-containing protein [Chloroflexota bacterium]